MPLIVENKKTIWSKPFFLGGLGILVFFSSYIFYGKDSVWYANDYLELVVPWYKLLVDQGALFKANDHPISGMIDTLPRGVFASEWFLKTWFFYFLEPFYAILFNKLLIHLLAYISAYHFLRQLHPYYVTGPIVWYAILWATLPFWPEGGIGTAFLPTVFYMFYRLYHGRKLDVQYFLLISFYVLYAQLHLHGLFVGLVIFVLGVYQLLNTKRINWPYSWGLLCFTLGFALANYRLFQIFFFSRDWFVPHRVEHDMYSFTYYHQDFWGIWWNHLSKGITHGTYFSPVPILLSGWVVIYLWYKKRLSTEYRGRLLSKVLLWAVFLGGLASLIKYTPFLENVAPLRAINQFSYDRFSLFIAPLLMFALVLSLDRLWPAKKWAFVLAIGVTLSYHFVVLDGNHKNKFLKPIVERGEHYPTYREFYARKQFASIKEYLNEKAPDGYKVGSLGVHPAVATFNGLHSIDGYTGNYPLSYKHQFFKILDREILPDNEEGLYSHFMGWGNKCYLFNRVQGDHFIRCKWFERVTLDAIRYDYEVLLQMGCRYLISTDPFKNQPQLQLLHKFAHPQSAWDIYLYEIQEGKSIL